MSATREFCADLLIAGGAKDPNLHQLAAAAQHSGWRVASILHGPDSEPPLEWDIQAGRLLIDQHSVAVRAAFLRFDVFNPTTDDPSRVDRSLAWFTAVHGWVQGATAVRSFNRTAAPETSSKAAFLIAALRAGLQLPRTLVTNDRRAIVAFDADPVVKPTAGGTYCVAFEDVDAATEWSNNTAPAPVFVQERLVYPEFRVFVVGIQLVVFEIHSEGLDHRSDRTTQTTHVPPEKLPNELGSRLLALAQTIGLDFCAFDLKSRPSTGDLCLLEANSGPMFATFDQKAKGALTDAMVRHLCA